MFDKLILPIPKDYIDSIGRQLHERISDQRLAFVDMSLVQVLTASNIIRILKDSFGMFPNTTIRVDGIDADRFFRRKFLTNPTIIFRADQSLIGQMYEVLVIVDTSNFDVNKEVQEDKIVIKGVMDKADPLVLASYLWKTNEEKVRQLLYMIPDIKEPKLLICEETLFSCKIINRQSISYILLCIIFLLDQLDRDYRIKASMCRSKKYYREILTGNIVQPL